jgi:hypothetical protein
MRGDSKTPTQKSPAGSAVKRRLDTSSILKGKFGDLRMLSVAQGLACADRGEFTAKYIASSDVLA